MPARIVEVGLGVATEGDGDVMGVALLRDGGSAEVLDLVEVLVVEAVGAVERNAAEEAEAEAVAGDVEAWSVDSALAGTQAATVSATSNDPAAAGQWRSGRRIMRRCRRFRSARRPR